MPLGRFSSGDITGWENRGIRGLTRYAIAPRDGRKVLCASADGSASAFAIERTVDLGRTPVLEWSWRIERPLPALDEATRAGHDFAARVTIIERRGIAGLSSRALNYVWSTGRTPGSSWPNPFDGRSVNIAVQAGRDAMVGFNRHRRDVAADFRRVFGEAPQRIDGVAVVTDADNSGASARACYGDIRFLGR